jgi:pSer/pThr/pTyr-binding forkhead associated (FHA) protein
MELFEKMNRAFGGWYEGLFGASDDVRPKDILRKVFTAMEDHRKEGIDNKVYVPNQYILEIAVDDEEEKEYLLSFLDRSELETAVRRYCQQNSYHIRGGLDFTIKEVATAAEADRKGKVRVRCRYDSKIVAETPVSAPDAEPPAVREAPEDDATIYDSAGESDLGTIPGAAPALLEVHSPDRPRYEVRIERRALTIGRSSRAGNDLILDTDGMVSRKHARIELESDGRYTIYDLGTTNGTRVNGKKVENHALESGDEIFIGSTRLVFKEGAGQAGEAKSRPARQIDHGRAARLVVTDGERDLEEYVLASETLLGRAVTNDVVLPDRSVATRHLRIRRGHPFQADILDANAMTLHNGRPVSAGAPFTLNDGDRICAGTVTLRFEGDAE